MHFSSLLLPCPAGAEAPRPRVRLLRFGCVEEAEILLRRAGLAIELLQLCGGALEGDLLLLRTGPLKLLRIRLSLPVHVRGPKPPGHQVVTMALDPAGRLPPLRAHGHLLPGACLFGLAPSGEIHLVTAASTHLALVLLERHRFRDLGEALGIPSLEERVLAGNWLSLDPGRYEALRVHLLGLFAVAEAEPQLMGVPALERLAWEDLMPLLLEALVHGGEQRRDLLRPPARIELVKLAQRWMLEHPCQPISLDALCREVHAGRRSLIQGFREHLGMGPMAFLKLQRLHALRRLLRTSDPRQTRIQQLAADWGFLNPGHFARDYRLLFGELPSETLGRRAGRPQGAERSARAAS
ncbi:MAG: helix-turn-helix domain-containing protein [Synechococcaceae cyanobacterium]|nr:helix-turn-helix domain-containing protein [Synechococcaceae cyanobacterium]